MIVYEKCAVIDILIPSFTMTGTSKPRRLWGKEKR